MRHSPEDLFPSQFITCPQRRSQVRVIGAQHTVLLGNLQGLMGSTAHRFIRQTQGTEVEDSGFLNQVFVDFIGGKHHVRTRGTVE